MEKCDALLKYINKVKILADQLVCLEMFVRIEDVLMTS